MEVVVVCKQPQEEVEDGRGVTGADSRLSDECLTCRRGEETVARWGQRQQQAGKTAVKGD